MYKSLTALAKVCVADIRGLEIIVADKRIGTSIGTLRAAAGGSGRGVHVGIVNVKLCERVNRRRMPRDEWRSSQEKCFGSMTCYRSEFVITTIVINCCSDII